MQLILAIFLMSVAIWAYKASFSPISKKSSEKNHAGFLNGVKRKIFYIAAFLACYALISYTVQETRKAVNEEMRQEQIMQSANQMGEQIDAQEIANIFEQSKKGPNARGNEIRVIQPDEITTKFTDVAGLTEAKDEVQDIVRFLQNPEEFGRLGAKAPKGVLLYGEPGTGKTLMARAIAGEAKVAFIAAAGSEFDEEYIGVGAARVRQLFATARQNAPCIIFIDEIDALAHKRHTQDPGWSAQTVNQLLAEMDGLDSNQNAGIVVIGASNRLHAIDGAVLRAGRLDRHIKLDIPTLSERVQVLNVYLRKVKLSPKVRAEDLAKMTAGFSSAELATFVNEAAIVATKANKKYLEPADFDAAKDRIVMGSKRAALNITEKTRKITAFHEAGHALIGHILKGAQQPLYKVTITPRGASLGHTAYEPKTDFTSIGRQELEANIATILAGRIAEEIIFGEENITTGAESDLKHATDLAFNMVTRWGYSKRVGLIHNSTDNGIISPEIIEEEVQAILNKGYEQAKGLLLKNRLQLNKIANALLERETLDAQEVNLLLANHPTSATL